MRVYYNEGINAMVVEGSRDVYPPRSLHIATSTEYVEFWLRGENIRLLGPVHWTRLHDSAGNLFPSFAAMLASVQAENEKGEDVSNISSLVLHFNNALI